MGAILDCCEQYAQKMGMGDRLNDPRIQNILGSFRNKSLEQVIPHAEGLLKEQGKLAPLLKFFGAGDGQ